MHERIVMDPAICNGRPVVRGTRITLQTVIEFLAAGDSIEEVIEEFPTLTHLPQFDRRQKFFSGRWRINPP